MSVAQQILIRAVGAHQSDRVEEARSLYRLLLAIDPSNPDGLHLLGLVEKRLNRTDCAIPLMRRALHIEPYMQSARHNLRRTLQAGDDRVGSQRLLRQLVMLDPADAEALCALGISLMRQGQAAKALMPLRSAAVLRPDHQDARILLSEALVNAPTSQAAGLNEALSQARCALMLHPDHGVANLQMALVLEELARAAESLTFARRALRVQPDISDARHIAGINRLRLGDFVGGMADMEARKNNIWFRNAEHPIPVWDGRPLPDDAVVINSEGGWGDMIQFIRFIPQVARICGEVAVVCPPPMRRLLSTLDTPGNVRFNPDRLRQPRGRAMVLSLPHLLGSTPESIPNRPYLSAEPDRVKHWAERLAGLGGLRVGICWTNGDEHRGADFKRSIPFDFIRPLGAIPGVSLVNLQKQDNAAKRLADADEALLHRPGPGFDAGPDAFLDTAAVIKGLDLVIAIDSAVLHVAGALGAPVWLAAPYRMDWRWMNDAEKSIWYPSLRIYRQDRQWDWSASMARIACDLARAAEAKAAGLVPDLLPPSRSEADRIFPHAAGQG